MIVIVVDFETERKMSEGVPEKWTADKLQSATKKELVEFLQQYGNTELLVKYKLKGKTANIVKLKKKPELDAAYEELYATNAFRTDEDALKEQAFKLQREQEEQARREAQAQAQQAASVQAAAPNPQEPKGYTKSTTKKGDKTNFPKRGDTVKVRYQGKLDDGTVFDSNKGKNAKPLTFKVGIGQVIRGWDEALLEMSVGETAEIVIEPSWAYGAAGRPPVIPPNSRLTFEVELMGIV